VTHPHNCINIIFALCNESVNTNLGILTADRHTSWKTLFDNAP
jgi:hypothetical protein